MNKNIKTIATGFCAYCLVIILSGCLQSNEEERRAPARTGNLSTKSGMEHRHESNVTNRFNSEQERMQRQRDEMIRRVSGIIEGIGSAEERLKENEEVIRDEARSMEEIKGNAKTSFLGGQMSDFHLWQRIGREKRANIVKSIEKAEKTIVAARNGAELELRRVRWVSSQDKEKLIKRVSQRLTQLDDWKNSLNEISNDLSKHENWLEANE